MPSRRINVPAQYVLDGSVLGNSVRQLRKPAQVEVADLVAIQIRKTDAYRIRRADGTNVALIDRRVQSLDPASELLYAKNLPDVVSGIEGSLAGTWLSPVALVPTSEGIADAVIRRDSARASWINQFKLREETKEEPGLRPPQVGALYAVLAHWKVSFDPATVVMPTGTGKTEAMLALLAHERFSRLLVIVPTKALREQIGEKFLTWGKLQSLGVLPNDIIYPVVGLLKKEPKTPGEVDELFQRCNVIVTTMAIAGQCDVAVQKHMAALCSHLFIDEAHHISARTWDAFRKQFSERPVVQFTATPFRNDTKHVDGRVVFNYPLKKAQLEGYFKPIRFVPIDELDSGEADSAIADQALATLRTDLENGFNHIIMARCDSIPRAHEVFNLYKGMAPEMHPALLHHDIAPSESRAVIEAMRSGNTKVVVCVNMLGEGFDLPELKIAAIHDAHRSLAITLQFTGRFTRSRADLGEAAMIANIADPTVEDALRGLYAEDADWNALLQKLSHGANTEHTERSEFLAAFSDAPEFLSLQNILPKMSTVVFRTKCTTWRPDLAAAAVLVGSSVEMYAGPTSNEVNKVLLFITREQEEVPWGDMRELRNVQWHLYLLHWDGDQNLLFINSSNKFGAFEDLAKAVCGDDIKSIRGEVVYRSLHNVQHLVLNNLGLSDVVDTRLRHSQHSGLDISDVLPTALREQKKKSNLFGRGYDNGVRVSVGASQKGRIWSMAKANDLASWVKWCRAIGAKLLNENISTENIFQNVILPSVIKARPALVPLLVEWPESFLLRREDEVNIVIDSDSVPFYEAELEIVEFSSAGPIRFRVVTPNRFAEYSIQISDAGVTYSAAGQFEAIVKTGRSERLFSECLRIEPPVIRFEDGCYMEGDEYFHLPRSNERKPYDRNNIKIYDWTGVDLKKESQKLAKHADSIQRRVIERLLDPNAEINYEIVFDDDGSGEAADLVCLAVQGKRLLVHFYHLKFSKEATAGARVDDLYALCGQAQRSIHWRNSVPELLLHLRRREERRRKTLIQNGKAHVSRFEKGGLTNLRLLMKSLSQLVPEFRIFVVQPGMSRAAVVNKQLELLAATEVYLMATSGISLSVVGSA